MIFRSPKISQRDYMRRLVKAHGRRKEFVCRLYAQGERDGIVSRKSNRSRLSAEEYAEALWEDGEKKGWF